MAERFSNSDIMQTLGRIEEKVDNVTQLAQKTNGRVTTIENWKNALEAVEQYKKESGVIVKAETAVVNRQLFFTEGGQRFLIALAGLLTVVGGYFAVKGGL